MKRLEGAYASRWDSISWQGTGNSSFYSVEETVLTRCSTSAISKVKGFGRKTKTMPGGTHHRSVLCRASRWGGNKAHTLWFWHCYTNNYISLKQKEPRKQRLLGTMQARGSFWKEATWTWSPRIKVRYESWGWGIDTTSGLHLSTVRLRWTKTRKKLFSYSGPRLQMC